MRTTPAALAARSVTPRIPIVILSAIDPVRTGLAASLGRPGGNVTGLTTLAPDLSAKRVQLLKEVMPRLLRLAVLWNSADPANAAAWTETQEAARALGVQLQSRPVEGPKDFERVFEGGGLIGYGPDVREMAAVERTTSTRFSRAPSPPSSRSSSPRSSSW